MATISFLLAARIFFLQQETFSYCTKKTPKKMIIFAARKKKKLF